MIIFVGDRPSPKMKPGAKAFQGAACERRLMEWIEVLIPFDDLDFRGVKKFDIINQVDVDLDTICSLYLRNRKIIALGNTASKALIGIPHFKLPHPSGRNRQINNKEFIAKKLEECKKWLAD